MYVNLPKHLLLGLLLLLGTSSFLFAQFNYIQKIDHTNGEYVHAMARGEEGQTVVLYQNSSITSVALVLDSSGNQVLSNVLPGVFTDLMVGSNGDFYGLHPDQGNFNLVRFNSNGTIFWHKLFTISGGSTAGVTADLTPQGNIVVGGTGTDFFGGPQTRVVMVEGSTGNLLWSKVTNTGPVVRVRAMRNGGCMLVHNSVNQGVDNGELHVLDPQGNVVWTKKLSGIDGTLQDAVETVEGDIVALVDSNGIQPNGRNPKFLMRMDSIGDFLFGIELTDTAIGVSVSGYFFSSLEANSDNGVVLAGQRQYGDIVVNFTPFLFWMDETLGLSYGLDCFESNIPLQNFPISSQATGLGEAGSEYFGYAINSTEIFSSNSETYVGRRKSQQLSSCEDCVVKFRSFQANDLLSITRSYNLFSVTEQTTPWSPSPNTPGFSSVCFECQEQVLGGFISQVSGSQVDFQSTLVNADSLIWDFGDGNAGAGTAPSHTYAAPGNYTVCLTGYGLCDTLDTCQVTSVLVGLEEGGENQIEVFPVPAGKRVFVKGEFEAGTSLKLMDLYGRVVVQKYLDLPESQVHLNTENLPSGTYFLEVGDQKARLTRAVQVFH